MRDEYGAVERDAARSDRDDGYDPTKGKFCRPVLKPARADAVVEVPGSVDDD